MVENLRGLQAGDRQWHRTGLDGRFYYRTLSSLWVTESAWFSFYHTYLILKAINAFLFIFYNTFAI